MLSKRNTFLQETVGLHPFDAIQLHHYTRIHYFLRNGLDPNFRDRQQRTLLMSACNLAEEKTALKFTNLLLKYNARIELKDVNGLNALHYAVLNEHKIVVERLLQFAGNFNINMVDCFGNTALMLAVFTRNYDIVQSIVYRLRKYDLSVDIGNSKGVTPLMLARLTLENRIAKCLIENGKASTEIRVSEKHWRQCNEDWQHDTRMYIDVLHGSSIYTTIAKHLDARNSSTYGDGLKERSNAFISNPILKRAVLQNPSKHVNSPTHITRDSLPKLRSTEKPLTSRKYQHTNLKSVYNVYEQELSTSYRKGVPLRVKTNLCASSEFLENQDLWHKTIQSLKQRRHTIALSHSLPNNISTNNLFGSIKLRRHAQYNNLKTNEAFEKCTSRQNTRRNSLGLTYSNSVPATAPGGLETRHKRASISGDFRPERRRSVSFQSPDITQGDLEGNSPYTQRSTLQKSKVNEENNIFSGAPTIIEEE